jgi:hypothetical protein
MNKIRIHHGKEFEAFELQTDETPCKLIAAVFYQENDEHRLVLAEAEKYASLFAAAPALLEALKFAQTALADWRDGEDTTTHPEHGELNLEEVKYFVVDTAIELAEKEGGL